LLICNDHVIQPKHKVFLRHSGAQKSFVVDLCANLKRCDQHLYFDKLKSNLPIEKTFFNFIFYAIKQWHVGIGVLLQEFFMENKWLMLEFMAMVEELEELNQRIKIILVFYIIF
jgi:hypothetical protein